MFWRMRLKSNAVSTDEKKTPCVTFCKYIKKIKKMIDKLFLSLLGCVKELPSISLHI